MLLSNRLANWMLLPIQGIVKSAFRKYLIKTTGVPDLPDEELVRLLGKGFGTNSKCNGCGICTQVCPVNNIEIIDNRPVWLHRCETCLACYHWCPNKAVRGGITPPKEYSYRHPEIKLSEIM